MALVGFSCAASAGITLIGVAGIAPDATDKSGLDGTIGPAKTPANRLGSFGSAIAYTGKGMRFVAASDRGPDNGEADYLCRVHEFELTINPGAPEPVTARLVGTTMLRDDAGRAYTGLATAFDSVAPEAGRRLDPEGLCMSPAGTIFTCDEYGPWIDEFSREGKHLRRLVTPGAFHIAHPAGSKQEELPPANAAGRVSNRGLEGVAITPDGGKLFAILQSPLIQDGALDAGGKHAGTNDRMLEIDLRTGKSRQFLYPLDAPNLGCNELLAVNDHEFLVIERDGKEGKESKVKTIRLIDTAGATDISGIASLPATGVPAHVTPVAKRGFINLLDPAYGLAGGSFPEKVEGLAFGPDLPDGRHTLVVTVDNDFRDDMPSWFWVFAVDAKDLPGFEAMQFLP